MDYWKNEKRFYTHHFPTLKPVVLLFCLQIAAESKDLYIYRTNRTL